MDKVEVHGNKAILEESSEIHGHLDGVSFRREGHSPPPLEPQRVKVSPPLTLFYAIVSKTFFSVQFRALAGVQLMLSLVGLVVHNIL